jgi:DNA topoisomerase-2
MFKDIQNKTTDENNAIHFNVEFKTKEMLDLLINLGTLESELKLIKKFSTNNMYLFNENLILTKYPNPEAIITEYYKLRIEYYQKRKLFIIKKLKDELLILQAKTRFITEYINGELNINRKSKEFIVNLLITKKYPLHESTFDYLLNMPVYSFTLERITALEKQYENKKKELEYYLSKTKEQLWQIDLIELQKQL